MPDGVVQWCMTDGTATRDGAPERSEARRQHAPADVAPELYNSTDSTDGSAADSK